MKEIVLQPGEFFFGQDDTIIRTHLGSCVAITMWHPEQKRGGMCHYMLPSRGHNDDGLDGRYADEAIQLFINEISKYPAPFTNTRSSCSAAATCLSNSRHSTP